MKLKSFMAMLLSAVATLGFTACDDDENNNDLADTVVTNVEGYTLASGKYFSNMLSEEDKLAITKTSANTVNVLLTSNTWGEFTINDAIVVSVSDTTYMTGMGEVVIPATHGTEATTKSVLFTSYISNNTKEYIFSVPTLMANGTTISFYEGQAPVGYKVANAYSGTASCAVNGVVVTTIENFKTTVSNGNDITIAIPEIVYGQKVIPAFNIENVKVTAAADGTYSLSLDSFTATTSSMSITASDLTGTISGSKLSLSTSLTIGAMPMPLVLVIEPASAE